jgi:transposase
LAPEDDFSATWIFDKLKGLGYTGGYDTVRCFVRDIKAQQASQAYIRFETEPGRQAQMDWADFKIISPGGHSVNSFTCSSWSWDSPGPCSPGSWSAAAWKPSWTATSRPSVTWAACPRRVLYDNMKHVVIGQKDRKAVFNHEFVHFAAHYGFTPIAAPPYSPWVKGKVERPIDYIRERFWRGYRFETIEQSQFGSGQMAGYRGQSARPRHPSSADHRALATGQT